MLVANANEVSDPRVHDRARASARARVRPSSRSNPLGDEVLAQRTHARARALGCSIGQAGVHPPSIRAVCCYVNVASLYVTARDVAS
jgi:hypothetical protein